MFGGNPLDTYPGVWHLCVCGRFVVFFFRWSWFFANLYPTPALSQASLSAWPEQASHFVTAKTVFNIDIGNTLRRASYRDPCNSQEQTAPNHWEQRVGFPFPFGDLNSTRFQARAARNPPCERNGRRNQLQATAKSYFFPNS